MDERGGTEGMQWDDNEERGFRAKTVLGEIKPSRDDLQLCNCFILASFEQQ